MTSPPAFQVTKSALTQSSRAWDLDGDGKLDEAELALKAMDVNKTGEIAKPDLHKLMAENLNTQRELHKMKKVVFGLVGITCVLAIANMGTSIAAAVLSKDTMTQGNTLVNKNSGQAIKTDSFAHIHKSDKEATEARRRERRLECTDLDDDDRDGISCTFHGHIVPRQDALDLLQECEDGSDVDLQFTHDLDEDHALLEHFCICPPSESAIYVNQEIDGVSVPISGNITKDTFSFWIRPEDSSDDNSDYVVSWDE